MKKIWFENNQWSVNTNIENIDSWTMIFSKDNFVEAVLWLYGINLYDKNEDVRKYILSKTMLKTYRPFLNIIF